MSKHDKTHVEEGFFNVHNRQLHELCDCLRDTHIFQKSEIALAISELLGVAYTQIRNPDSNLSLLGRS